MNRAAPASLSAISPWMNSSARNSIAAASSRRRSVRTMRISFPMIASSRRAITIARNSRHSGGLRCPSAAIGGISPCTAILRSMGSNVGSTIGADAAAAWARASVAMNRNHGSIAWLGDMASNRAAVLTKRHSGTGKMIGSGAFTPPLGLPVHFPFDAISPCLTISSSLARWDWGQVRAIRSLRAHETICDDGEKPTRASRNHATSRGRNL